MGGSAQDAVIQFVPLMVIQLVYVFVAVLICRKSNKNPWIWGIAILIPGIGMFSFVVFFVVTILSMLDRIRALEESQAPSTFS